ncbi:hypothetical protein AZJ50_06835 [Streptococcus pneumoniae]|nr:hypothetical protein AZJ50_06835 [Streptococcus pneumoniae]
MDEQFQPYEDQWRYLQEIQRVSTAKVALLIQEELGKQELDKELKIVLSNMIQLEKSSVTPKTLFFLKNMASFSNPEFYLKQAMRQPTYQIPERMYLFGESDHYLWLPRGLLYPLQDKFKQVSVEDRRKVQRSISSDWIATDSARNQLILKDILAQVAEGRNILVLVNRIQQIDVFEKLLKEKEVDDCYIISGKTKVRERTSLLETLEQLDKGFVLLSTGKYIGEGFDLPQLDTLILAAPFSWKNNLIQYAGRIHRNYKDKSLVRIFDYVDIHVPYLEKMFQKRQVAYRKMDYRVIEGEEKQFVYVDSRYEKVLREDLAGERQECLLILPYVHQTKLMNFLKEFRISQIEICIPETVANKAWLDQLKSKKIKVSFTQIKIVMPILLVNKTIVWYGAMPLLGKVDEMTILRLESASIASELVAGLR